jgi:hypothetical protein
MHFTTLKSITIVAPVLFGAIAALPVARPGDQLLCVASLVLILLTYITV